MKHAGTCIMARILALIIQMLYIVRRHFSKRAQEMGVHTIPQHSQTQCTQKESYR